MNVKTTQEGLIGIVLFFFSSVNGICGIPSDALSYEERNYTGRQEVMCNPPFALKALSVTDTSALLDWNVANAPAESEWEIEIFPYGNSATGAPTHTGIVAKPVVIENLEAGTKYFFKVRSVCTPGNTSAWTNETGTFITEIVNGEGCDLELPIPDAGCPVRTEFPISVRSAPGTAMGTDVVLRELRISVLHEWLIDLEFYLRSPSGRIVTLIDESGGTNNNFGDPLDPNCSQYLTLLNASACDERKINEANPPFTGRNLPLGNFNDFNDGSSPLGQWTLMACDDALVNVGFLQFVELVFEAADCAPPSSLEVLGVDSTTVLLDWSPGGHCNSTVFEYGAPGFTPGTGTVVNGDCPPYMLTGLSGGTAYEIYILEDCGSGVLSNYACEPVEIYTICSPPPVSVREDFDDKSTCLGFSCDATCTISGSSWRNAKNDQQDWLVNSGSTFTPDTGPGSDLSGTGNYIYLETSSFSFSPCPAGSEAVLLSNCIEVDTRNTDSCHLSFAYHMFGREINSLRLEATTDGLSWTTLWSKQGEQGNQWKQAKISLSGYDGETVQFRLIAAKGTGGRGDIAIDEILFNGSNDLGEPSNIFYLDADGDGYGDAQKFFMSCFSNMPPGYVANDQDCNDNDNSINLVTPEIPCNSIDENCNGLVDDFFLPPPGVSDIDACDGEDAMLTATANYGGEITWYDENFDFIGVGNPLPVNGLTSNGTTPAIYTFYAEESSGFCFSSSPAQVEVTVRPNPEISTPDAPVICAGELIDLENEILVIDANNTAGQVSFHTGFPADDSNKIDPALVFPQADTEYIIKTTATGGCEDTTSLQVTVLPAPEAAISPSADTIRLCRGESVFFNGTASGGQPSYQAIWSTFETSPLIRMTASGDHGTSSLVTYKVTDANLCVDIDTVVLTTVTGVDSILTTATDVSFCNGNNGSIAVQPLDGMPPFTYTWDGPVSGSRSGEPGAYTITGLEQGSYSITVADSSPDGCLFIKPFTLINGPSARVALDSVRPVQCYGENNGAIYLDISASSPIIQWSNSMDTEDVENLPAGSYSVTVTDGTCLTMVTDIVVEQPDSLYGLSSATDANCFGSADGNINVQVFGGTAPYSFEWNDNNQSQNRNALGAGTYNYTITDANNCTFASEDILLNEPSSIQANWTVTDALCFGTATGKIDFSASGGTSPYRYHWSNGAETRNLSQVSAGIYSVTVIDSKGCEESWNTIEVASPAALEISVAGKTNASCNGVNDGSIDVNITGGTGNYSHEWNNGETMEDLAAVAAGDYVLTVTDQNQCEAVSDTITVDAPTSLVVRFTIQPPTCEGREDGNILLEIRSGGQPPFEYEWSTGDMNRDLLQVGIGLYDVTITDSNGCIDTYGGLEVTANQALSAANLVASPPVCFGDDNGIIFSNILGGNQPYQYSWSNNATTSELHNLPAGDYVLTVTDNRGCQLVTDTITLDEPPIMDATTLAIEEIPCHDDNSGAISVEATGGVSPYQFIWNNGQYGGPIITNLPGGVFNLVVVDSRNCVYNHQPIVINNPSELDLNVEVFNLRECNEDAMRDSVFAHVSGGNSPYSYLWSRSDTTNYIADVVPGEYSVTVSDENGCQSVTSGIKVSNVTTGFKVLGSTKEDISCFGAKDGQIVVTLEGGTPPFQYLWSDGAGENGGTIDSTNLWGVNLEKGFYKLVVVDDNGCVIETDSFEIVEPDRLLIGVQDGTRRDVTCYGGSDGRVNLNVRGGTFPYEYEWIDEEDNFVTSRQNPIGLPAGIYKVVVTDEIGCIDSIENLIINQPDSFYVTLMDQADVRCKDEMTGSLSIRAFGGTFPYAYFWDNGARMRDIENLEAGTYMLTVEDANHCQIEETYMINEPADSLLIEILNLSHPLCNGEPDGEISFEVTGGTPDYIYLVDGQPIQGTTATGLGAGSHTLMASDRNACVAEENIELTEPEAIELAFTTQPVSQAGNDGSATVTPSGGIPPFSFEWSNGGMVNTITSLAPGTYFVTVTDSQDCKVQGFVQVKLFSSVEENPLSDVIVPSPNPFDDVLTLNFDLPAPRTFSASIRSATGSQQYVFSLENIQKGSYNVSTQGLASGWYFLQLEDVTGVYVWRLLKIKP